MPLHAQIVRDNEPLSLNWGYWHLERIIEVATTEDKCDWRDTTLYTTGRYEVKCWHGFVDESDGEVLEFNPGDVLTMHY